MKIWSFAAAVLGAGLLCAPAFADTVTSRVVNWNSATHQLTLADRSKVELNPAKVTIPEDLAAGDEVVISYVGSEDGMAQILSVTVRKPAQSN